MTEPIMCYIAPGKKINLAQPDLSDVSIGDIAYALANQTRYNGALGFYSVARHSIEVVDELLDFRGADPQVPLAGLLHDAHEAFIGDITRPVKQLLGPTCEERIRSVCAALDRAIERRFGLPEYALCDPDVLRADESVLEQELRCARQGQALRSRPQWDREDFLATYLRLRGVK